MNRFRRPSPRRLATVLVSLVAAGLLASALVVGAFARSEATPPLDQAIQAALAAPPPPGITARIVISDDLFDSSGPDPGAGILGSLLSGAEGELWIGGDGRAKLDLQTGLGAIEFFADGTDLTAYAAAVNTAWTLALPAQPARTVPTVPSLAQIDAVLADLGRYAQISAPAPGTVAGQAADTVTLSPSAGGGLLGSLALSFDAADGVPLQLAVDARGSTAPALELTVSSISYAAVPLSDVEPALPSGVNVITLAPPAAGGPSTSGLGAVTGAVPFTLVAPDRLDGLRRSAVRTTGAGSSAGALVIYGTGPGAIVLDEMASPAAAGDSAGLLDLLPRVSIDGMSGHELVTGLGTIISFVRAGVSFTLVGSVDKTDAEAAAQALAS